MFNLNSKAFIVAAGFLLVATAPGPFAQEPPGVVSEPWQPLQKAAPVEVMDSTMTFEGEEVDAQAVLFRKSSSSFSNALVVPLGVVLSDYQTLSFMIKMDPAARRLEDFRVEVFNERSWYLKNGPRSAGTKFFKHAVEISPGEYFFLWQFADIFEDFDMAEARFIALIYPTQKIPEGEVTTLYISPVTFQK